MKALTLVVLALGLSQSAHAAQITVQGTQADALLTALSNAGAAGDCGMGRCGTSAANIVCESSGQVILSCSADLQNESGDMTSTLIPETQSQALAAAISSATGASASFTKSIDCTAPNGDQENASPSSCTIEQ